MAKTVAEVIKRALEELKVVDTGHPVSAEDAELIDVQAVALSMAAQSYFDITDEVEADAVPSEIFMDFAKVVAAEHAAPFGVDAAMAANMKAMALGNIKAMNFFALPMRKVRVSALGTRSASAPGYRRQW